MKIEDNFLEQKDFDELQTLIMGVIFDWHYGESNVYPVGELDSDGKIIYPEEVDKNKFQFIHMFYHAHTPHSQFLENLSPIVKIIQPISLIRIKANLLTRTPNIVENGFHVDMTNVPEEKQKQLTTSIFYVNTDNGYTVFEDGTKVESVANRMITFPANMKHTGTSCTDQQTRIVINFNYFEQ